MIIHQQSWVPRVCRSCFNHFWLAVAFCYSLTGCSPIPQGGGPMPRQVFVVPADLHSVESIAALIALPALNLDPAIDKTKEMIKLGDGERRRFQHFEHALWYASNGSEYFGIALVKWNTKGGDTANRYFIDVYAEDKACGLCSAMHNALEEAHITFYAACDQKPPRTEYEAIRCDS